MSTLTLQFSSSTAFASQMIRRLCHSPYSHVDIVLGTGLLGVSGPDHSLGDVGGVRVRPFNPWPYKIRKTITLQSDKTDAIIKVGRSQIGKPFDQEALYSFLSDSPGDRDWRETETWFCSEWLTWSLEQAGFFPYSLVICKNRVSPADLLLLLNPFMTEDQIHDLQTGT